MLLAKKGNYPARRYFTPCFSHYQQQQKTAHVLRPPLTHTQPLFRSDQLQPHDYSAKSLHSGSLVLQLRYATSTSMTPSLMHAIKNYPCHHTFALLPALSTLEPAKQQPPPKENNHTILFTHSVMPYIPLRSTLQAKVTPSCSTG